MSELTQPIAWLSALALFLLLQAGYWAWKVHRRRQNSAYRLGLNSPSLDQADAIQAEIQRLTKQDRLSLLDRIRSLIRHKRRVALEDALPHALEIMVFSLRAGHGLPQAIQIAAEEMHGPLADELRLCHEQIALGRPVEVALEQMRRSWPRVAGLESLVEAVLVLQRTGGNLVEVLERIGTGIKARAAYRAKHRSLTAEGRMSGAILMVIPLGAAMVQMFLAPHQFNEMMQDGRGQLMALAAVMLWLIGGAWVLALARPGR